MTVNKYNCFLPEDDELLKHLHLIVRIPLDQYGRRPGDLRKFAARFNDLSGRGFSQELILARMIYLRKAGRFVTLDGRYHRMMNPDAEILNGEEWSILRALYIEFDKSTDELLLDAIMANRFAQLFAQRSGKSIAARLLVAVMVAKRKRGLWPQIGRPTIVPFADIDEIDA